MNIKKLILVAVATLGIVGSQAHGSALKTGMETAKNSLSTLAQTKLGKAVLDHKGKIALAAGAYYAYRLYKYKFPNGITTADQAYEAFLDGMLEIVVPGYVLHWGCEEPEHRTFAILFSTGTLLVTSILKHLEIPHALLSAVQNNNGAAFGTYLNGFGAIRPNRQTLVQALAITQNPAMAQQLIDHGAVKTRDEFVQTLQARPDMVQYFADHGIANSAEGHAALLKVRPDIAQQVLAPKHKELTRAVETAIPEFAGGIANEIASFDTGITVKKPMPESAKRLAAETEPKIRLELQQIVEEVYAESNKYKERLL